MFIKDKRHHIIIGDKQGLAFVRIGNESVVADRLQLKSLVMRGAGCSFDAIPTPYKFEDMSFSKLKSVHFKRLNQSFDDSDFVSWGIVDNDGKLTNAGALLILLAQKTRTRVLQLLVQLGAWPMRHRYRRRANLP